MTMIPAFDVEIAVLLHLLCIKSFLKYCIAYSQILNSAVDVGSKRPSSSWLGYRRHSQ